MSTLQDKRILITGATSGIGQQAAIRAARAGADVAFCGISDEGSTETIAEIEKAGRKAYFEALDLMDLEAARRFARSAIEALGGLDGFVNNAAANFWNGVLKATFEQIQDCFMLNFYAGWAISQEVYPALKEAGGGVIVNIASIHAERTLPTVFPYNVSKAMVVALTKSQAIEWGPDNIRSIAIAPGLIRTPMSAQQINLADDPERELARLESHYPLKRSGRPGDVASLIVYLLSDDNGFISGNTILVDGGISALMDTPEGW